MSENNENVPKIRFPVFTDAWEQRKVGDLLSEKKRPIKMKDDEEYQLITVKRRNEGIVSRGYFKGKDILVKSYFEIRSGDYLISKRQVVHGANGIVPESLDKSIVSNEYLVSVGNKNITTEYWTLISKRSNMYKQFFLSSYGVDIEKLVFDVEDWKKRTIILPSLAEQKKITLFFQHLDHLITLHQRKLNNMQNLKTGLLQKMFPRDGDDFPEVRFPGFTNAWEPRSILDLADRYDSLRVPITASNRVAGSTPYYGANGIQDYVNGFTHDGEFILVAEDGANDLHNYPVQYVNGKVWVNNHAHVLQAKENIADNKFLMNAIRNTKIEPFLVGGGRAKLNADVMMKIKFSVPKLAEQIKIGAIFVDLDHLITLHQRKLEHLQDQKKALLQQMFV